MSESRENLKIEGFRAPGIKSIQHSTPRYIDRCLKQNNLFQRIQYDGLNLSYIKQYPLKHQFVLKGYPVAEQLTVQSEYDLVSKKIISPKHSIPHENKKQRNIGKEGLTIKHRDQQTLPFIPNRNNPLETQNISKISQKFDCERVSASTCESRKKFEVGTKKRTRLTRSTKMVPPPTINRVKNFSKYPMLDECHDAQQAPGGDYYVQNPDLLSYVNRPTEGNKNCNNPRRARFKNMRRHFESLASYIHFYNIFHRKQMNQLPALKGFPAHCTDTVLIQIMIEMTKLERENQNSDSD